MVDKKENKVKPFPLRFELPSPAKCLRVERVEKRLHFPNVDQPHWRLWLMANGTFTLGTFIQLLDNGTINRVTWHEDGTESVMEVKDATEKP